MITRDILNSEGNVIGQAQFPEGTSEDTITRRLSSYLIPDYYVDYKLSQAQDIKFAQDLLAKIGFDKVMTGSTPAEMAQSGIDFKDVLIQMISGNLRGALIAMKSISATSVLSLSDIMLYGNDIRSYLGLVVVDNQSDLDLGI